MQHTAAEDGGGRNILDKLFQSTQSCNVQGNASGGAIATLPKDRISNATENASL